MQMNNVSSMLHPDLPATFLPNSTTKYLIFKIILEHTDQVAIEHNHFVKYIFSCTQNTFPSTPFDTALSQASGVVVTYS